MVMGWKCRPHPGQVKACWFQIGTLAADRGLLLMRRAIGGDGSAWWVLRDTVAGM